ncbi:MULTISPECIES: flavin reductase family protein [Acetobacter]|uniref:Flavin reductase family protein n=1 Tax=Acetobacter thailandicus TaxID=1502842 RepID=A0ABT3QBC8_9PROT|nr:MULTISPECIES: flavin reductase family protein [Acetobacter]MBS0980730.1 flavin reductase family protein [Acetobacter thailandicus]MBS0984870.1 flavin reductase family protein [Acetobacter thailandicus]MCX2562584.1 flavin reductase family protein [Acetobacter thailandicus]NHN94650.1 flavin reductase [Acetobacter thailandicus]OUI88425.1 flavin mononucleotide reductase [Acetobacter sp. DmW_043]
MTSVTSDAFRSAMSHFATGVAVITARGTEGECGATISAFSSVSLDPLTLLICLHHKSATCRAIEETGKFGISILRSDQKDMAMHFAGRSEGKSFDQYCVRDENGHFFVKDALVQISVSVVETLRGGTHEIFLARPESIEFHQDQSSQPLVYFRGAFDLAA